MISIKQIFLSISIIIGSTHSVFAIDENELNERIAEMAKQQGVTDKEQIKSIKNQITTILITKERFTYDALKEPCKSDIDRFCSTYNTISDSLECIKENREMVTNICEEALIDQFGSKPLKEAQLYNGVLIPKGSTFFGSKDVILGAITTENFSYKGINFKKGQIRFHEVGISMASLAEDQFIDGIKYKAEGIGPFFHKDGTVENATLAEDTEIGGIVYKAAQITFHANNKVKHGTLAQDVTIDRYVFKANRPVWLDSNGVINKSQYEETEKKFGAMYDKSNK